jgi:hypothetical protein
MAGYPPNPDAPPPQAPPPWTPMPQPMPMMAPPARPMNWSLLGFIGKALGLLLIFVGTLVGVIGLNPSTTPNITTIDNTVLVTRLLWTIGLAAIATGAGIKLRYVAVTPAQDLNDGQSRVLRGAQWRNTLTFLIALIFLFVILFFLPV